MAYHARTYKWSGTLPVTSGNRTICVTGTGDPTPLPPPALVQYPQESLPPIGLNFDVFHYHGPGGNYSQLEPAFADMPALRVCNRSTNIFAPVAKYSRAVFVYETMIME
jgi:hypothetical protein